MPLISTNMHFGKLFIENSKTEIHIPSFLIGMISIDTIDEEDFDDFHTLDEDGNLDVREFYEQFNFDELDLIEKSFILGYYCHLWFDEYYKFNASKLIIHNNVDLTDEELGKAIRMNIKNYDYKAINSYFEKYKNEIQNYNKQINIKQIEGICVNKSKEKILEFLNDTNKEFTYPQLIKEQDYLNLIKNGSSKIMKSL